MTKKELKKITTLVQNIEKAKQKLSDDRDYLRGIYHELEAILASVNGANADIGTGLLYIKIGIEEMGQYV
jgi:hypothetical protein